MIVVTADSHLHLFSGSPVLADGSNARLADAVAALDAVLATAVEQKAKAIVHLGDLFHDRKGVPPEVIHRAGEWLDRVHAAKIELHLLVGNHDMSLDAGTHALRGFKGRAILHDRVETVEILGARCGFIPYMEDPKAVAAATTHLRVQRCEYLFAHLGLGDPKYANCVPVEYEVPGRISLDDLRPDDFSHIFLGHYHLHQRLTKSVQYVGSPLQLSFGEADHPKGWTVLDEAKGTVRCIANESSPKYHIVYDAKSVEGIPDTDFVWVKASDRTQELAAQALARPNTRIDRAVVQSAPARIDPSSKGAALLRAYVRAVKPDALEHEIEELVAEGLRLKGGT
jgi:DNA repair exonuclease SbcCD nuclease subunit